MCYMIPMPKINFGDGYYLTYEDHCNSNQYFVHMGLFDNFKVAKFEHIDFVFLNHIKNNDLSQYDIVISPYLTKDIEDVVSLFVNGNISVGECEYRCSKNKDDTQVAILTDYVKDALISKINT